MQISGSCSCGAVSFHAQSRHPVPYQRCYCSICVKTSGAGGFAINTSAEAESLQVEGPEHVKVYRAKVQKDGKLTESKHERHFCGECGSHLWAFHPSWPELIHPVAGALDGDIPAPSVSVHMMVASKCSWVELRPSTGDTQFDGYPEKSLADFHEEQGWTSD